MRGLRSGRVWLLFSLLWLCSPWAMAATAAVPQTLEALQQQLTASATQRCHFSQQKRVAGLAAPLVSRGQLLFNRQLGLWWQQEQPFAMTLLLDEQRLLQQVADQPPERITASSNPPLFEFSHLLLSLFGADRAALERAFLLTFTPGKQSWQLTLVPRQAPLDRIFRQLALSGRQGVEQLRIQDRQGDETLLDFTDCRYQPEELTDVERHRFAR